MKAFLSPLVGASLLLATACGSNNNATSTTTEKGGNMATTSDSSAAKAADSSAMAGTGMAGSGKMAAAVADPNGPTAPHANDKEFMQSAAHSDQNEIQLSKLALSKGVSAPVQAFANKMIADHMKSTANLKPIAQKAGVTLPTDMDAEHQAMAPMLAKLSGKTFEAKYVQQMVTDHQKTANTLKAYQPTATAIGLKGWIDTTLPVVLEHLSMAKQDSKMAM